MNLDAFTGERCDATTFGLARDRHVAAADALHTGAENAGGGGADKDSDAVRTAIRRIEALLSEAPDTAEFSFYQVAGSLERALLERAISKADGNLSAAARTLGITSS